MRSKILSMKCFLIGMFLTFLPNLGVTKTICLPPVGFSPIRTIQDLQNIEMNLSGSYFLCNDIDASNFAFHPIGNPGFIGIPPVFSGVLNGNFHQILYLQISAPAGSRNAGLFGIIRGGRVENITFRMANVSGIEGSGGVLAGAVDCYSTVSHITLKESVVAGNRWLGGIAGNVAYNAHLSHIEVDGSVSIIGSPVASSPSVGWLGGIAGYHSGTIEDSYSDATVTHTISNPNASTQHLAKWVGGIAGAGSGKIITTHAGGKVQGHDWVGGLTGTTLGGWIERSYSTAQTQGIWNMGGLAGYTGFGTTIVDSFSAGSIEVIAYPWPSVANNIGGLFGMNWCLSTSPCSYQNIYSVSPIAGIANAGTRIGDIIGNEVTTDPGALTISAVYYDDTVNPLLSGPYAVFARSHDDMTTLPPPDSTYEGWDFQNVWTQQAGFYPTLR